MVHVLRHSFQPSVQFESALNAFVKPGLKQPRFLIQTIASLALDADKNYSAEKFRARQDIDRFPVADLQIGPHVAARRIGGGALRLLFELDATQDSDGKDINKLNYLAMINRTKNHLPAAEETRDVEDTNFTFYTTISAHLALPIEELRAPAIALKRNLQSASSAPLYRVVLDGLPESVHERALQTYS